MELSPNNYTPYVGSSLTIVTNFGNQIVERNGESAGDYNSLIVLNSVREELLSE
ncbi:MAG: hypothetical protein AB7F53_06700 [Nitrososphaeraceae archaeon]